MSQAPLRRYLIGILLVLAPPTLAENPAPPSTTDGRTTTDHATAGRVDKHILWIPELHQDVRHLVFVPSTYKADDEHSFPLIVGLHGTAGRPHDPPPQNTPKNPHPLLSETRR